jgi:hypothetical protein
MPQDPRRRAAIAAKRRSGSDPIAIFWADIARRPGSWPRRRIAGVVSLSASFRWSREADPRPAALPAAAPDAPPACQSDDRRATAQANVTVTVRARGCGGEPGGDGRSRTTPYPRTLGRRRLWVAHATTVSQGSAITNGPEPRGALDLGRTIAGRPLSWKTRARLEYSGVAAMLRSSLQDFGVCFIQARG